MVAGCVVNLVSVSLATLYVHQRRANPLGYTPPSPRLHKRKKFSTLYDLAICDSAH